MGAGWRMYQRQLRVDENPVTETQLANACSTPEGQLLNPVVITHVSGPRRAGPRVR